MALQSAGEMSFADVYNEITGESLPNPPISITLAELGQLQNISGQAIPLNQNSPYKPDGILPTVFPDEWYRYCQTCGVPKPFLQITKQAATSADAGVDFNYFLTITNNGEASTSGNITIYDTIPNNIIIRSVTGSNFTYTVVNQNVTITYTGTLGVGQSASFYIIIRTFYSGTYYNQASCVGGGDNTIRYSNTTATTVATATYTATKTERRDRTLQRNNCGDFGTGSYVQVWSPYFTNTYTSFISQADADAQATNLSVTQAINWLDANAQAVANSEGTCGFEYPTLQLTISGTNSIRRDQFGNIQVRIRVFTQPTTSNLIIELPLPSGLAYNNVFNSPPGWILSVSNNTIIMMANQNLPVNYDNFFTFQLRGITNGTYNITASSKFGGLAANVNSNTFTINVTQPSSYFLYASSINNDFTYTGDGIYYGYFQPSSQVYAVPGDAAAYVGTIDIFDGATANDQVELRVFIPSHFPPNLVQCSLNEDYFTGSANMVAQIPYFSITNKQSVPVGSYSFVLFMPMDLDYYNNDNQFTSDLTVRSTGQVVQKLQMTSFYLYVNNSLIPNGQKNSTIRWAGNYRFDIYYQFINIPNNPNSLNYFYKNYLDAANGYGVQKQKDFNGIAPFLAKHYLLTQRIKDPARGTGNVNSNYGNSFYLYYVERPDIGANVFDQYVRLEFKIDLFQFGQEIVTGGGGQSGTIDYPIKIMTENKQLTIEKTFFIFVNSDGTYRYGNS
jgi:hypothetical protein